MKTAILKISGKTISEFIETNKWIELIKNLYEVYDSVSACSWRWKNNF